MEEKKSWPHQGIRNALLASLKDMQETGHFKTNQEADILEKINRDLLGWFLIEEKNPNTTKESGTSS